jgi:hypothetical protein
MPRKALQIAAFFAASLLALPAQEAPQGAPDHSHPTVLNGIAVPPIAGAPFSATLVIENDRYFLYGSDEVRRTINLIARDSKGRTHSESRRLMPESFHGSPQLLGVRLYDPETHVRTIYDPVVHVARQQMIPEPATVESAPDPASRKEDLGTSTFDGVPAKGTRRTVTVPARASGTGDPADIEDEVWHSDELRLDLLVRHSDSRFGTQTIGVSGLKREEPPASMFEVPQGYKIVVVPPAAAPAKDNAEAKPIP